MLRKNVRLIFALLLFVGLPVTFVSCAEESSDSSCTTSIDSSAPSWISSNFSCVTATVSSGNISINTDNIPNHDSYYFGSDDSRYEDLPSGNNGNPNTIAEQDLTVRVDMTPTVAGSTTASGLGAVGVSVGGVALFNNSAAPGDTLADELATMDQSNGHPTDTGAYHHHTEPLQVTNNDGNLVGVMADGFPVFGRLEPDGSTPTYSDACTTADYNTVENCRPHGTDVPNFHCHTLPTSSSGQTLPGSSDGDAEKCHYHVLDSDPYMLENFAGTEGNVSN